MRKKKGNKLEKFKLTMFTIYTILFELIVWGLFGWAVFVNGHSGWWIAVALLLSTMQLKPKHFGLDYEV